MFNNWAAKRPKIIDVIVPKIVYHKLTRRTGQKSGPWIIALKLSRPNTKLVKILGALD